MLVEVHDEAETERALALDAELIGVNSRNLKTLEVDPDVFGRLAPQIPADVVKVAESGITGVDDVRRFVAEGAGVVLVGEALVKDGDPEAAVRAMTGVTAPMSQQTSQPVRYDADERGYFGETWGGRFMPEALVAALDELTEAWQEAMADAGVRRRVRAGAARLRRHPEPALPRRAALARPSAPGSCSSARTSTTPAPTRSATCSARRCSPGGWARPG